MSTDNGNNERILQLDEYWPYLLTVLADRIARHTTKIVKEKGLNLSQWRVLAAIAEKPGRTSVEVVTITPMDKGIVSRATKALLLLGLVRREASQLDGRISHLYLTSAGMTLYRQLFPQVKAILQRADIGLSNDQQQLLGQQLQALIKVIPDLR